MLYPYVISSKSRGQNILKTTILFLSTYLIFHYSPFQRPPMVQLFSRTSGYNLAQWFASRYSVAHSADHVGPPHTHHPASFVRELCDLSGSVQHCQGKRTMSCCSHVVNVYCAEWFIGCLRWARSNLVPQKCIIDSCFADGKYVHVHAPSPSSLYWWMLWC